MELGHGCTDKTVQTTSELQKDSLHCAVRKIKYCQRSCQKHIFLKSTTFAFTMERMHSISKCNCVEVYKVTNTYQDSNGSILL